MSRFVALLGQRLRRDWVQLVLWTVGTALLAYLSFVGVAESYATAQDRTSLLAAAFANPVILLFRGLPSGAGEGAFMVFLIFPWLAIPQVSLRYKPIKQFQTKVDLGFSTSGFFFGASASYGL